MFVRVDDPAVARPDLDAHDLVLQHVALDHAVESSDAGWCRAEDAVRDPRLDDLPTRDPSQVLSVADRLGPADVPHDQEAPDADKSKRGQTSDGELGHRGEARRIFARTALTCAFEA